MDGVKNWAMRLGQGENALAVADVRFLAGEEEESSGDEGEDDQKDEEGNENESEAEVDVPVRNGRKRGRGRGRGRTKGGAAKAIAAEKAKAKEPAVKKGKKMPAPEDVQVKLNGVLVDPKEEKGEWHVELLVGAHVLEVGSKGGAVWKVFVERGND
jgi:chromatin structure-remodeling complex subunit RSC4